MRALELAVDKITVIMGTLSQPNQTQVTVSVANVQNITTVTHCSCQISHLEVDLHEAVSMQLADSLRELIEHGLESVVSTESLSCLSPFSWLMSQGKHAVGDCPAWQVLKHFYQLKVSSLDKYLILLFMIGIERSSCMQQTREQAHLFILFTNGNNCINKEGGPHSTCFSLALQLFPADIPQYHTQC